MASEEMPPESTLWLAIKRLRRAKSKKAHPKMIEMLDERVGKESSAVINKLGWDSGTVEENVKALEDTDGD